MFGYVELFEQMSLSGTALAGAIFVQNHMGVRNHDLYAVVDLPDRMAHERLPFSLLFLAFLPAIPSAAIGDWIPVLRLDKTFGLIASADDMAVADYIFVCCALLTTPGLTLHMLLRSP